LSFLFLDKKIKLWDETRIVGVLVAKQWSRFPCGTPKSLVFVFEKDKKSPKISVLKIANYEKIGKWEKAIKVL